MKARRILMLLWLGLALFWGPSAHAEETPAPAAEDFTNPFFTDQLPQRSPLSPAFDPLGLVSAPAPVPWTYYQKRIVWGDHSLTIDGGLNPWSDRLLDDDNLPVGQMRSSVAYRYHGLFGGIVRPVTRFTIGAAQTWRPLDVNAARGFTDAWTPYAVSEAGLEIVYRGVGVGMTAGYAMPLNFYDQDAELTGFPFPPGRHRQEFDWSQLLKNIYLIVE